MKPLVIDGSYGEGGGQVLRTSLALSAILRQPVEIQHIRAGRKKAGLRPQHIAGVKAVALTTKGRTEGVHLGSTRLFFEPRTIQNGTFKLDVGTAGSAGLVLQAMLPGLFFGNGPSQVTITGGTHVPWSPCFHYLDGVFLPALKAMNGIASVKITDWGWYPRGGGRLIARISPASEFIGVERMALGTLKDLVVLSAVSNLPVGIGKRQKNEVVKHLARQGYSPSETKVVEAPSPGTGTVVFVQACFENGCVGFSSLGARGKPAETVGEEAAAGFLSFVGSGATVDRYLADQLAVYMALAAGRSSFTVQSITRHLMTNIWVIEQFLPVTFQVDESSMVVSVEGVGFIPPP
jgi:RNA 3'-terminal phosphate cyclase (ATP)